MGMDQTTPTVLMTRRRALACGAAGFAGLTLQLPRRVARQPAESRRSEAPADVFKGDAPDDKTLGALAKARLGEGGVELPQARPQRAVQELPEQLPAHARRPQPLPQQGQPGRHALHDGLWQPVHVSRRSGREEAAVPFSAGQRGLFPRHLGLRLPLPQLPELGDFPEEAGGDQGPARAGAAAAPAAAARPSTTTTWPA